MRTLFRSPARLALGLLGLGGLLLCAPACPAGSGAGGGGTAPDGKKSPSVALRSFDGTRGVFRIHNDTGRTVRRVAVGLRGFGCKGPRATRTEVKIFDLKLRPGQRQSFAFHFEHPCKSARVAVASQ